MHADIALEGNTRVSRCIHARACTRCLCASDVLCCARVGQIDVVNLRAALHHFFTLIAAISANRDRAEISGVRWTARTFGSVLSAIDAERSFCGGSARNTLFSVSGTARILSFPSRFHGFLGLGPSLTRGDVSLSPARKFAYVTIPPRYARYPREARLLWNENEIFVVEL